VTLSKVSQARNCCCTDVANIPRMRQRVFYPVLALLLLMSSAQAQTADWRAVEGLPPGAPISVRDRNPRVRCIFRGATSNELVCEQHLRYRSFDLGPYQIRFDRQSIREVRLERPGDSALAGAVIGGGIGAAIGASIAPRARGTAALFVGGIGALLGGHVGTETSIVRGPIIYKR
jgi:hypothetical protein